MSEIRFQQVRHAYGERAVLDDVNVVLTEPRIGIVGANGSGKSTLARMINGLVVPTSGSVTVDGLDTGRKGREVRKRVGFVFTDPDHQIVMPTVAEPAQSATYSTASATSGACWCSAPSRSARCASMNCCVKSAMCRARCCHAR